MFRLGTVPYLNAQPLLEGLQPDPDLQLVQDVPSALVPRLRAGELDLALVSAVELFRQPELGWLPDPAITSAGPVRSILLFLNTAPEQVRRLALDSSSLSAAAMAQVCLTSFFGVTGLRVDRVDPQVDLGAIEADAILRIGDPALRTDAGGRPALDLGAVWTGHTGLPFVYALWLGGHTSGAGVLWPRLCAARDLGLLRRGELALRFAADHGMDPAATRDYLEHAVGYRFGARERQGLTLFGQLAHEQGLVDSARLPAPLVDTDAADPISD